MFKNDSDLKKTVSRLNIDDKPNPAHRDKLRWQMLSAFNESKKTSPHTHSWQNTRRIIMKSKITKFTTAAVIIIAVLIGINQFGGSIDMASVAWAEVLEVMENVPTVIFEMTNVTTFWGNKTVSTVSQVYDAGKYGNRVDIYMNDELVMQKYAIPNENIAYIIKPKQKTYSRFELPKDEVPTEIDFPRQYVKAILSEDYTHLGSSNIDGFDVEGVEVNNSEVLQGHNGRARLWVDVETNLPVQIELLMLKDDVEAITKWVMRDFQWNVGLYAENFIPDIPDDYVINEENIFDDSIPIEEQPDKIAEIAYANMPTIDDLKFDEIVPGLHFGIFTLGMTKDEVIEIRGDPTEIRYGGETYTLDDLPSRYYLSYGDISFFIMEGSVKEITAQSPFYKIVCYDSDDGLRVGDSEQRVKNILGDNYRMTETEWKDFLTYHNQGITFEIHKSDRTIMEIGFGPKP